VQNWVESELAGVDLGDKRREARVRKLVDQLSQMPEGTFNQACPTPPDRKAAYRFFANKAVDPEAIGEAHRQSTWRRIERQTGRVLVAQDTSSVDYSRHPRAQGLGPLETPGSQGYLIHSGLALSEQGEPLGLLHQQVWVREEATRGQSEARRKRPWSEKESHKWQTTVEKVQAHRREGQTFVIIGDRESDVYGLLASPRPEGVELLVRSAQNRKVQAEAGLLHQALRKGPAAGQVRVEVGRAQERPARQAFCEVRFRKITLLPPRHADAGVPKVPVTVWAVAIDELHPPKGETALRWVLLATWPIERVEAAIEAAGFYSRRWLVERYHFVLKSGCRIEASQLQEGKRLHRLETVYSIIAWRLLALTYQARLHPQQSAEGLLERQEWQVVYAQQHQALPPKDMAPPSLGEVVQWIANLGGHWGRKGDAPPGVKVLWRGLTKLSGLVEGFLLAVSLLQAQDVGNG